MSAKKKRRKIAVNNQQKTGHCGPDCENNKNRQLGAPRETFATRLRQPTLVDLRDDDLEKEFFSELGQECLFEVYATGLCHPATFDSVLIEHRNLVLVEGRVESTSSRSALVELISYCEDQLNIETFIIAIPKKRHDHRIFVNRLTNFLDFELIPADSVNGWSEDFVYVSLEL